MAIETFRRNTSLSSKLDYVLTDAGYVNISSSPFLGSIVGAIKDTLDTEFRSLYEIADNIDIGRAAGPYLDRWGRFLNEPRTKLSFASDLTLSNTKISITPTRNAGLVMLSGTGIPIPKGTRLSSEDMKYGCELLDDIIIRPDRSDAYCRVICVTPGITYIPAGSLTRVDLSLSEISGVLPSAISKYSLVANNTSAISGGTSNANDEQYRYILLKKAESLGLFNTSRIESATDIDEVVQISIKEYRGGVSVFVETKYYQNSQIIVDMLRAGLKSSYVKGMNLSVFPPIYRNFTGTVSLTLRTQDPTYATHQKYNQEFCRLMNAIPMGATVNVKSILDEARKIDTNILAAVISKASYNYRDLITVSAAIGQEFNEKLLTKEDRITVI